MCIIIQSEINNWGNTMKRITVTFWTILSLIFGEESLGMRQEKFALISREKVFTFVSNYEKSGNELFQYYDIEEKPDWEGNTNTEGYRDPQIFIYKSYNGINEKKEFVIKAVLARCADELEGSNKLIKYLNGQLTFSPNTTTELRFSPILFSEYTEKEVYVRGVREKCRILLELMERAPGIPISNWFFTRYFNNDYSQYNEVMGVYHNIGNAVAYMHNRGITHYDLHGHNLLMHQNGSTTVCSIIDWDRPILSEEETIDSCSHDIYKFALEPFIRFRVIGGMKEYESLDAIGAEKQMIHRINMCYKALEGFLKGYVKIRSSVLSMTLEALETEAEWYAINMFCCIFELSKEYKYGNFSSLGNLVKNNALKLFNEFKDFCKNEPITDRYSPLKGFSSDDIVKHLDRVIEEKRSLIES